MLERWHVDHIPAWQCNVRCDSRTLLPERLFGDLHDNLLPFFQEFGDRWHRAFFGPADRAWLLLSRETTFGCRWCSYTTFPVAFTGGPPAHLSPHAAGCSMRI